MINRTGRYRKTEAEVRSSRIHIYIRLYVIKTVLDVGSE